MSTAAIQLEKSVLGACLANDRFFDVAIQNLTDRDFANPVHRQIFAAAHSQRRAGRRASVAAISPLVPTAAGYVMELAADFRAHSKQVLEDCFRLQMFARQPAPPSRLPSPGFADQSPIEARFLLSLNAAFGQVQLMAPGSSVDRAIDEWREGLRVFPQAVVLDWPVDFLMVMGFRAGEEAGSVRLVVELDGHDFHERTKEQARRDRGRDRALLAAGHFLFRFTGSEIHAGPQACADEARRFLVSLAEEMCREHGYDGVPCCNGGWWFPREMVDKASAEMGEASS